MKQEAADLIDLQIVAFPQEGIESYPNGRELMTRAIEMGADVVGRHSRTMRTPATKGSSSVMFLMDLAQRYGRLVDVHCDEIDDPQSRVSLKYWRKRRGCAAWGPKGHRQPHLRDGLL
ncbi:hypothetical protein LNP74_04730 [Klebsiella pneumoniae subsp. pneumoniae]|nr:hypothetical protein [Klebsiella pneumoniae subsp. pneumoniae]